MRARRPASAAVAHTGAAAPTFGQLDGGGQPLEWGAGLNALGNAKVPGRREGSKVVLALAASRAPLARPSHATAPRGGWAFRACVPSATHRIVLGPMPTARAQSVTISPAVTESRSTRCTSPLASMTRMAVACCPSSLALVRELIVPAGGDGCGAAVSGRRARQRGRREEEGGTGQEAGSELGRARGDEKQGLRTGDRVSRGKGT